MFKYLGRLLDLPNNDCLEFLRNTRKARQDWGRLGKMLYREGSEPAVSEKFYCAVIQAVLFFGTDMWVLSVPMDKRPEGVYVGFLR